MSHGRRCLTLPRRLSGADGEPSAMRQARLARNWTLEDVVREIDLRTPGGQSGVTPSMVSGWELNHHATSLGHRRTLCEIYEQPPEVLFAYQDQVLARAAPRLLAGIRDLRSAMLEVVSGAKECLVVTGSRSRDVEYLLAIEDVQEQRSPPPSPPCAAGLHVDADLWYSAPDCTSDCHQCHSGCHDSPKRA